MAEFIEGAETKKATTTVTLIMAHSNYGGCYFINLIN